VDIDFCASLSSVKCKIPSEFSIRKIDFDRDADALSEFRNSFKMCRL